VLVVWSMLSHQAPPATALFEGARTELCSVCEVAWMDGKPLKKLARETGLEPATSGVPGRGAAVRLICGVQCYICRYVTGGAVQNMCTRDRVTCDAFENLRLQTA
jgi:hypothetical protein